MILNHLWGLYTHPKEEWHNLQQNHESLLYSASHILLIALIPAICSFFSSVYLGWNINGQHLPLKSPWDAAFSSITIYILMVSGVLLLALSIRTLARRFNAKATLSQSLELSTYASTPVFILGFCTLYPKDWFLLTTTVIALSYAIYLLYGGSNILINMDKSNKRRFQLWLISIEVSIFAAIFIASLWFFVG